MPGFCGRQMGYINGYLKVLAAHVRAATGLHEFCSLRPHINMSRLLRASSVMEL